MAVAKKRNGFMRRTSSMSLARGGVGSPRKTMVKAAIGLLVRPLIWRLRLNGQARLVLLHLIMLSFATQAVKPVVKVSFCLPVVRDRYCI